MKPLLHTEINRITNPYFTILYTWKSQERYWVRREREWFVLYSFFFVLIIVFLAILGEYLLIVGVISFVFLWFVQAAIPPEIVEHTITTLGIRTYSKLYKWQDIEWFWISEKDKVRFLNFDISIETRPESQFKKRITLVLNDNDEIIFFNLIKYLNYGDKDEVGFNIITRIIYGKYIEIFSYLPKEEEFDEDQQSRIEDKNYTEAMADYNLILEKKTNEVHKIVLEEEATIIKKKLKNSQHNNLPILIESKQNPKKK